MIKPTNDNKPIFLKKHTKQLGWGWNTKIKLLNIFMDWITLFIFRPKLNSDNLIKLNEYLKK